MLAARCHINPPPVSGDCTTKTENAQLETRTRRREGWSANGAFDKGGGGCCRRELMRWEWNERGARLESLWVTGSCHRERCDPVVRGWGWLPHWLRNR